MVKRSKATYRKEILKKYQLEKSGDLSPYLYEPTPGSIKEVCELLINERRSNSDIIILKNFFKPKNVDDIHSSIAKIDIDKFRPIVTFLREGRTNPRLPTLELASWLVDFEPRPFSNYIKTNVEIEIGKKIITGEGENQKGDNKNGWKMIIGFSVLFLAGVLFYNLPKTTECMVWTKSHYKKVACEKKVGLEVEPLDPVKLENFRKIEVNMATPFFDEVTHRPLIWYNKTKEGEIEFFSAPGLHPITKKTLDEITPYIIEKYVPEHIYKADSFVN